ncbi:hypothetical protein A6M14_00090 [Acinetobacter sp. Ac_877]|uniref:DUF4845 domain-containing protein n=1 Tax=Acinetobacter portensis TaxID=1839785 RepID=UPI00128DC348|nr:DUF4845 domain-containing protein [Acinetobacter portensis]MPW41060.1 hypothetical protein [Acinetobacter portensis]
MRKSQLGASYSSILLAVICFALIAKFAIAVWGPYFDDRMINGEISALLKNSPEDISPEKFNNQMSQRLSMNNIINVKFEDIAKVSKNGELIVKKDYEVRKPFLLNIDLVLKFEKNFDQSSVKAK